MGLLHNVRTAMAIQSAIFARGVAACLSKEAGAELMKDCGASGRDVAALKLEALRQKQGIGR